MQPYAHFPISETQLRRDGHSASTPWSEVLALCVPLLIFGATMCIAQYDRANASPLFTDSDTIDLGPRLERQVSFIGLGVYGMLLLLKRSQAPLNVNKWQLACLIFLCVLLALSTAWSDDLELTLKRSTLLLLTTVAALGVAKHWKPSQACLFVFCLTFFNLLVGLAMEIATGALWGGLDNRFGGTLHPNCQAVNCAILGLASLSLYRDPKWRLSKMASRISLLGFAAGTVFLLLTRSRTATIAYFAALVFFFVMDLSRTRRFVALSFLAMAFAAGILGVLAFDSQRGGHNPFVDAIKMGREQDTDSVMSLTGRVQIWQRVLSDAAERPLFGYGYGAFWTPRRIQLVSQVHDMEICHAHSAYFETLLNVGAVGLVSGVLLILLVIRSATRGYRRTQDCGFHFAAALLAMALIHGVLDGNFVVVGLELVFALICVCVVVLHGQPAADTVPSPAISVDWPTSNLRACHA